MAEIEIVVTGLTQDRLMNAYIQNETRHTFETHRHISETISVYVGWEFDEDDADELKRAVRTYYTRIMLLTEVNAEIVYADTDKLQIKRRYA